MFIRVIKYSFTILFIANSPVLSQEIETGNSGQNNTLDIYRSSPFNKKEIKENYLTIDSEDLKLNEKINSDVVKQKFEIPARTKKEESVFNILSASYRNNIRFGGFWEKYAIINFAPSVFIKPFSFLSVYANHIHSCFIPIEGIKEHMQSLFIQSAAILAVDNSFKLFFGSEDIIPVITGFAVKTIILNSIMSSINQNKENKIQNYKSYYFSVSIRF